MVNNFKDMSIFVGIDVHKSQWNVSIFVGNTHHKVFQQPPRASVLADYLNRHFPGGKYYSVYESGFCGFHVHRDLMQLGITNIVINPADVFKRDKDRKRKTDRIDATSLARGLKNNDLIAIYVPELSIEADRKLVRYRTTVQRKKLQKSKQRIKDLLQKMGKEIPHEFSGNNWSKAFISWLRTIDDIPSSYKQVLDLMIEDLELEKKKWLKSNRAVILLSRTPRYAKLVSLLRSIPGIGLVVAMSIATELVTMRRFKNLDHLCSYIGLVPNTYSSGDKEHIGRLTKRANIELRRLIIQAAWVTKRKDPQMLYCYEKLTQRMIGNQAIIRIARKLIARVRWVWLNECAYKLDTDN